MVNFALMYDRDCMCVLLCVTTMSCIACDAAALERVQAAELCLAPATGVCGLGRKCPWQLVRCTICSDLPAVGKDTRNGEHKASVDLICIACGLWCMCNAAVSSAQLKFEHMYHVYTVARHVE